MTEKFLSFRVWVRRNPSFLWEFNEKIGIDRSAAVLDTSSCAFETPILQDDTQAAYWIRKIADSGIPHAQVMLGALYLEGKGVEKNEVEGASWFAKAAEQGYPEAEYVLGTLYHRGKGVEMNLEQAKSWY